MLFPKAATLLQIIFICWKPRTICSFFPSSMFCPLSSPLTHTRRRGFSACTQTPLQHSAGKLPSDTKSPHRSHIHTRLSQQEAVAAAVLTDKRTQLFLSVEAMNTYNKPLLPFIPRQIGAIHEQKTPLRECVYLCQLSHSADWSPGV